MKQDISDTTSETNEIATSITYNNFINLKDRDPGRIYFCVDTNEFFVGDIKIDITIQDNNPKELVPMICKRCGGAIINMKCESCGTTYEWR